MSSESPHEDAAEATRPVAEQAETFDVEPPPGTTLFDPFRPVLKRLSSLKLAVAMFACSLFLVMIGTLAQVDADIWDVVDQYFRCWFAWIPLRTMHPLFARIESLEPIRDFFHGLNPSVGIMFPGGFLIGAVMTVNLVAAFIMKFRIQATGDRLYAGLGVSTIGLFGIGIAVASGDSQTGLQEAGIEWDTLWTCLQGLTVALLAINLWGIYRAAKKRVPEWMPLVVSAGLLSVAGYWLFTLEKRFDDSSMRILWQLIKGETPALVLLAGFIMLFKKRGGVVLIHAGVALMMFNEVLVHVEHIETQMSIEEGRTAVFAEDVRSIEIALVDSESDPDHNVEVIIPREFIDAAAMADADGNLISDPQLPFDIRIDQFLQNSDPRDIRQGEENPATAGAGLDLKADPVKAGVGTDSDGAIDLTSAYVTLLDRDSQEELGTYLLGVYFQLVNNNRLQPNVIEHNGKSWDLSLRFKRHYKPYSVYLSDVSKKDYIGTSTPRDYRSVVTITEEDGTTFERDIWMNNPLRYAGETFYQSNYTPANPRTGESEKTTLQVVRNTGWMIPYVSCMIVGTGLLAHFWGVLIRFLRRRDSAQVLQRGIIASVGAALGWVIVPAPGNTVDSSAASDPDPASGFRPAKRAADRTSFESPEPVTSKILSWLLALCVAGWLCGKAVPPDVGEDVPDLNAFGALPLVYEGRTKPFDTLARNSLRMLSNRTTFKTEVAVTDSNGNVVRDEDGQATMEEVKQPAILWLLDVMSDPETAGGHRVFRIENPQVQKTLGLEKRKGFMYSLEEFYEALQDGRLARQAKVAHDKEESERSADDRKLLELERKLGVLDLLMNSFSPPPVPEQPQERDTMTIRQYFMDLQRVKQKLDDFENRRQPPLSVPPAVTAGADEEDSFIKEDQWQTFSRGWFNSYLKVNIERQDASEPIRLFTEILVAHSQGEASEFNKKVSQYRSWLRRNASDSVDLEMAGFETYFNQFAPAFYSAFSYLFAFIFAGIALLGWSRILNRAALLTIIATFLVHTFALWARMEISGRPPVTNLYSSAVFIGWGGVLLGIVFEMFYRNGIGNIIGSTLGAVTLGIAYLLSGDGDTFKVLQAVLDTQFWLATHVVCITLGYSTTFIAGTLGQYYVLSGFSSRKLTPVMSKDLSRMIYGTVCFGIFFSFVGTVLGGLWADDSWGRFWGWDPKENGALLIVIWNALLLHARWDGMIRERGLAVLAIVGNIITSWSWFGVNELGVGLHSYGFTSGVWTTLWVFWLSQFVVCGIGLLPKKLWTSFRAWERMEQPGTSSSAETA